LPSKKRPDRMDQACPNIKKSKSNFVNSAQAFLFISFMRLGLP